MYDLLEVPTVKVPDSGLLGVKGIVFNVVVQRKGNASGYYCPIHDWVSLEVAKNPFVHEDVFLETEPVALRYAYSTVSLAKGTVPTYKVEFFYSSKRPGVESFIDSLAIRGVIYKGCLCPGYNQDSFGVVGQLRTSLSRSFGCAVECPEGNCHGLQRSLWDMIIHLNDSHKWTRETIADWVEDVALDEGLDISFPVPDDGTGGGS